MTKKHSDSIKYNPAQVEAKWQDKWSREKIYSPDIKKAKKPYYNLMMFPYPSAEGLHVGNMYAFTGSDIWGRYQRMLGNDVFEPIGLDGFGIHSENYAIKIGAHPKPQSEVAKKRFYDQLRLIGNGFDWTKTVETYDPLYYKWTQWIFIQMFKHGLAFRKKARVNWCPSCMTVLADEQVIAGGCERCKSIVQDRNLEQWFFKITDYAEKLLSNLEKIDWADKVKVAQKNWIGKSEGAEIRFKVKGSREEIKVFTTRPDTLYGATFMVLAVDSDFVDKLTTQAQKEKVTKYIKDNKNASIDLENREKTGVFTGSFVINPATEKEIPVYISNYVLSGYGSGAVMGVPAHDTRDFEFAKKYELEIVPVIQSEVDSSTTEAKQAYTGSGILVNSGDWTGSKVPSQMDKVLKSLESQGWGTRQVTYHLRDWLISRQRYWGPPIPMIFCQACFKANKGERKDTPGWFTVPEKDLPVELPYIENFKPRGTGEAPLAQDEEWVKVLCPDCGKNARRETDVSDTFLDSAWYFLRYPSVGNDKEPWDEELIKKWLPVHMYIGGAEHAVLHLLYSRFVTMALKDWGMIDFEEPFTRFYAHGMIIKEGAKMSKSRGNIVTPDEYIKKFGSDTLRSYLMFLGPFNQGGDFRDSGMEGMSRFLNRAWRLVTQKADGQTEAKVIHTAIGRVTDDLNDLRYNRALAGIMEYVNSLEEQEKVSTEAKKVLLQLLAPFAPHLTEELWQVLGEKGSIHFSSWPQFDPKMIQENVVSIPVQINGRLRGMIEVETKVAKDQKIIEAKAREVESIVKHLKAKPKKVIFVPGKLLNFVV